MRGVGRRLVRRPAVVFGGRGGVDSRVLEAGPARSGVAEIGGVAVLDVVRGAAPGLRGRERVDRVERPLEGVGVGVAGGEPEDDPAAGADDPGGDVEQQSPQGVGVTA